MYQPSSVQQYVKYKMNFSNGVLVNNVSCLNFYVKMSLIKIFNAKMSLIKIFTLKIFLIKIFSVKMFPISKKNIIIYYILTLCQCCHS